MSPTTISVTSVPWGDDEPNAPRVTAEHPRTLVTTLPDGSAVETPPDPHRPWTISAQCGQAQEHRETVRFWLDNRGWRRLPETTRRAA